MSTTLRYSSLLRNGTLDRIDSEFFDPASLEIERTLEEAGGRLLLETWTLGEERIPDPAATEHFPDHFSYIEIADVDPRDGFVLADDVLTEEAPSRARLVLREQMVLLSAVRPVRSQVFMVSLDLEGAIATTGFITLRPLGPSNLSPEVLFPLLKTRQLGAQLTRRARASMYPTLSPPDVLQVVIPPLPEALVERTEGLVRKAMSDRADFLNRAKALDDTVREYFEPMGPDELLDDLARHMPTTRSLTELLASDASRRMDAEYHSAAFAEALARMRGAGAVAPLGDFLNEAATGKSLDEDDASSEDRGGDGMLMASCLTRHGINWGDLRFGPPEFQNSDAFLVREGDIIFNSAAHQPKYMAHRVDVVSLVPDSVRDRLTFDVHLMRLRISDQAEMPPHYIAAFLRNPLGREQIRRCMRGVGAQVYAEDVRRILVPLPSEKLRDKIADRSRSLETARWAFTEAIAEAVEDLEAHMNALCA